MGPYCKFCDNRCFVRLGISGGRCAPPWVFELYRERAGRGIDIIATCAKGQADDKEKTGICHDEIPWEQDGDVAHVPEAVHLKQERDFHKAANGMLRLRLAMAKTACAFGEKAIQERDMLLKAAKQVSYDGMDADYPKGGIVLPRKTFTDLIEVIAFCEKEKKDSP